MHHNTYNLKSILQSDLDPTLCKLMLHQIKSPLLEHSFQLTADDDYQPASFTSPLPGQSPNHSLSHNNSYTQPTKTQRRNNNQSYQWGRNDPRLDQMSIAQSKFEQTIINKQSTTPRAYSHGNYNSHKQASKQADFILNQLNQEMVSPLQYYEAKPNEHQFNYQPAYSAQTDEKIINNVATWCGDLFDNRHASPNEIVFDNERSYTRKKIFNNNKQNNINHKPSFTYYTFGEAAKKLYDIQQYEVSRFIELLGSILTLLNKTAPHRQNLHKNENKVYKILMSENPVDHETEETIANKHKIINRLRVNKMSQALAKICNFEQLTSNTYAVYKQPQQYIRDDINKTLKYLSEVEDAIENYVSRKDTVSDLHKIYNLLYEREIGMLEERQNNLQLRASGASLINATSKTPSPISTLKNTQIINNKQENADENRPQHIKSQIVSPRSSRAKPVGQIVQYRYQQSLKQKICNFLFSLKIDPQLYSNIYDLNYIWSEFNQQGSYSPTSGQKYKTNKQKFINKLCRNDILIHEATRGITELNIEKKLSQMGFKRNPQ